MKKITTKVITISSQLFVTLLFLLLLFPAKGSNNSEVVTVGNNNFEKMAETTSILFEKEDNKVEEVDDKVVSLLEDKEKEQKQEEQKKEEKIDKPAAKEPTPQKKPDTSSVTSLNKEAINTYTGTLTGYAGDCSGCSGITAAGVDIRQTMYYQDSEYGTVRILAGDPSFPFYSIFRVSGVPGMDTFVAIVLDRGGNVGFGRGTLFDLAFTGSESAIGFTTSYNVKFELLRSGK